MPENAGTTAFLTVFLCLLLTSTSLNAAGKKNPVEKSAAPARVLVETIIASVNGKAITLRQLETRLRSSRQLDPSMIAADPEVRYMLDVMILEQVIQDEADARKINATDGEIDRYIEEIAARNQLSRAGFEEALQREGKKIDDYKRQVKVEILKSRLTGALVQAGAGVTNQEIKNYIEDHPELAKSGSKVKLSQIFVSFQDRNFEQARQSIEKARRRLESGDDFATVAKTVSEGAEAADGGSLGVLAEEDLNPVMFDAVFSLKEDEISDIVTSDSGFHIFKLQERLGREEGDHSRLEEEVRAVLEKDKTARRIQDFFTTEIFKKHSVDKKI